MPKLPAIPNALDLQELSSQYLRERNAQMKAKRLVAELELAFKREQLIEKSLVERQLTPAAGPYCVALRHPQEIPVELGCSYAPGTVRAAFLPNILLNS